MISANKKKILIACTTISLNVSANEIYIVKVGETLTDILYSKNIEPIYGKHGALIRTLKLNPKIKSEAGYFVYPKMKILLPIADSNSLDVEHITIKENNDSLIEPDFVKTTELIDHFNQTFFWEFSPSLSWKNLSSTDTNIYRSSSINALTIANYGISATYGMNFEKNIDIYSTLSLESVSFVENDSIHLLKHKFVATSFGVGVSYLKKWLMEISMTDKLFLTSPRLSYVEIIKVTLPEVKATYYKDFYQYKNASLFYSFLGNAFLPRTSPVVHSNFSYGAGAAIEAKLYNQSFKVGFDMSFLKSTGNSTNEKNIFWKYIWRTL